MLARIKIPIKDFTVGDLYCKCLELTAGQRGDLGGFVASVKYRFGDGVALYTTADTTYHNVLLLCYHILETLIQHENVRKSELRDPLIALNQEVQRQRAARLESIGNTEARTCLPISNIALVLLVVCACYLLYTKS